MQLHNPACNFSRRRNALRAATGAALCVLVMEGHASPGGGDTTFNRAFLVGNRDMDLSRFEKANQALPGVHNVDLFINDRRIGREAVTFQAFGSDPTAKPCFTPAMLERYGVDHQVAGSEAGQEGEVCRPIDAWVAQSQASYDASELSLVLSVPQAALRRQARGYVDPQYWDPGITAGFLGYNANTFQMENSNNGNDDTSRSSYLGLNAGFNLGAWQLRHSSSVNWQSGSERQWQRTATYVQRALPQWRSQLTLGEGSTSGELFDSIGYRGMRLATDDRMLPDSLRGYAPIVRGVVGSNALVEIRQNGNLIYQDSVPAGPYAIDDLYPTGYGGDLQVTVTEASGRVQRFSVPYASVAQLLRPGSLRYSVTAGQVREQLIDQHPSFVQGTLQYGFSNLFTGYVGAQISEDYQAGLLGGAFNTDYGAVSLDLTHASTDLPVSGSQSGESLKLGYSKLLSATGTNFAVAAYRYSTSGYLGLREALTASAYERTGRVDIDDYLPARDGAGGSVYDWYGSRQAREYAQSIALRRQRNAFDLTVTQPVGTGAFYISGSRRDYWGADQRDTQFRIGYNNRWRQLNYSVSATRSRDSVGESETLYYLTLSMPIGSGAHAPTLSSSLSRSDRGYNTAQVGLSGTGGEDNQFAYGVSAARDSRYAGSGSLNAQYRLPQTSVHGAYSEGRDYRQVSGGINGVVVAHSGGITLSPQQGETMGLVQATGAEGARVTNAPGVRVDSRGYAVVPYLSAYSRNEVGLDPRGTSLDVELRNTSMQVAPYAGAVVKLDFPTVSGRSVVIHAVDVNGAPLPFAAEVLDEQGQAIGVVGQASRLFVRGVSQRGSLQVKWGEGAGQRCRLDYQLPARQSTDSLQRIEGVCKPTDAHPPALLVGSDNRSSG
ncbi:fimbria/pilus outer membrane usher protein [Pseudomonas putida]|uniref:fimbria/pilus outer membrane usher protein n=1 Tax=Pseudomonas putida TaxID=303 RepID=UPI00383AEC53